MKLNANGRLKRLYAVLLVGPQTQIIQMPHNGVYEMIEGEDTDSLSLLFKLYSMVPNTLQKICVIVSKRIQDEGTDKLHKAYRQVRGLCSLELNSIHGIAIAVRLNPPGNCLKEVS